MIGEADEDWGGSQVEMIQGGGQRCWGRLIRKDLRGEMGTFHPVDIFPNQARSRRLFQARNGTACNGA